MTQRLGKDYLVANGANQFKMVICLLIKHVTILQYPKLIRFF